MTRSPFLSFNLASTLFLTWAAAGVAGCEDLKRYLPSGTDQLIEKSTNIGGAVLNRPQFSEADEERMAQENAVKFEQQAKLWDDPLLDSCILVSAVDRQSLRLPRERSGKLVLVQVEIALVEKSCILA